MCWGIQTFPSSQYQHGANGSCTSQEVRAGYPAWFATSTRAITMSTSLLPQEKTLAFWELLSWDHKSWLIGKDPHAGKEWRPKEKEQQRMRWLDSITDSMDMNKSKFWELVKDGEPGVLQSTRSQRAGHDWAAEQQHCIITMIQTVTEQLCWDPNLKLPNHRSFCSSLLESSGKYLTCKQPTQSLPKWIGGWPWRLCRGSAATGSSSSRKKSWTQGLDPS